MVIARRHGIERSLQQDALPPALGGPPKHETRNLLAGLATCGVCGGGMVVDTAATRPIPRLPRAVVESRLEEWRRLLRQSTTQARAVLQRVLQGRATFTPNGAGYDFTAPTRFDKLFAGVVYTALPAYLTQSGDEGRESIRPEDTLDADYGQLLEKIYGKGLASHPALTWHRIRLWLEPWRAFADSGGAALLTA